jgi:hypothetical protein
MRTADAARAEGHEHAAAFERGKDPECLLRAATSFREAYGLAVAWDDHRDLDLAYICICLRRYYDASGQLWALDEAVVAGRAAVANAADPDRAVRHLTYLGVALLTKAEKYEDRGALREAVTTLRQAVYPLLQDDADKAAAAHHLADALHRAYRDTDEVPLLAEAVHVGRFAVRTENPLQLAAARDLAEHLVVLGAALPDPALYQEAVATARWRAETMRATRPETYCQGLFTVSQVLDSVWHRTKDEAALREALRVAEYAGSIAHTRLDQSVIAGHIGSLRERLHGQQG